MATVSAAEYAKLRNISKAAVSQAIAAGKLPTAAIKKGQGYAIDVDLADREWAENTDPLKGAPTHLIPKGHKTDEEFKPIGSETLAASKAKREAFMAELARLEYEQKAGTLVPADEVKKQAYRVARMVRDTFLNIPDRISAELAAETDAFKIHKRMTAEIKVALLSALGDDDL